MSKAYENALEKTNYFFTGVFVLECGFNVFSLGWKGYWIVSWNKFDFLIVLTSSFDIIFSLLMSNTNSSFLRIGP